MNLSFTSFSEALKNSRLVQTKFLLVSKFTARARHMQGQTSIKKQNTHRVFMIKQKGVPAKAVELCALPLSLHSSATLRNAFGGATISHARKLARRIFSQVKTRFVPVLSLFSMFLFSIKVCPCFLLIHRNIHKLDNHCLVQGEMTLQFDFYISLRL